MGQIRYDDAGFTAGAFVALAQRVWPRDYDAQSTARALDRTINIGAWDDARLIGAVRVLTDGHFFATVPEILVDPEYQGRGIGRELMSRALAHAPRGKLFFGAQPQSVGFFERIGCQLGPTGFVATRSDTRPVNDEVDKAVVVRSASDHDLGAVVYLNGFVQDVHARRRPDIFVPVSDMENVAEYFRTLLSSPDQGIFVAELDGELVGYVHAEAQRRAASPFTYSEARAYVHQISVHPDRRRRGVGRALMAYVDAWATSLGLSTIALDSWTFNAPAQRFFESLGFTGYNVKSARQL